MYKNHVHLVTDRIASIRQPWVRSIVRGKASAPAEFGPNLDVSIASGGYGWSEKVSFDAYNESGSLTAAVERYRERTGRYPRTCTGRQNMPDAGKPGLLPRKQHKAFWFKTRQAIQGCQN